MTTMPVRAITRISFALIIVIGAFLLLEGGARIIETSIDAHAMTTEPGWQAEFFGRLFDWHEPDPDLLWRFKAGLVNSLITTNSHHLLGPDIDRAKPPRTYRVMILGDSSPVGLGLASRRDTFPALLKILLEHYFAGRKEVEIINAAVSGYTSEQIVRFLSLRGWAYEPDAIVVYCGNNDASLSGPLSDRELLSAQRFGNIRTIMSNFTLYRLMRSLLVFRSPADESPPVVRVSPEEYRENLRTIADHCQKHSCRLLIVKPPVPRLWPAGLQFKPFLHIAGKDGKIIIPPAMQTFLSRDVAYCLDPPGRHNDSDRRDMFTREVFASAYTIDTTQPDAVGHYRGLAEAAPDDPVAVNNLAVALWRVNDFDAADTTFSSARRLFCRRYSLDNPIAVSAYSPILYNTAVNYLSRAETDWSSPLDTARAAVYLDSALQADYFSLRIKQPYLDAIDSVASASRATIVPLPEIFARHGDEQLFVDHCHPTAEGHVLIAEAIYQTLFGPLP